MFLIQFGEESSVLQRVQIHFHDGRPDSDTFGRHAGFVRARKQHIVDRHFGRDHPQHWRGLFQRLHVEHGASGSLVRKMLLVHRHFLLFEQNLVRATHRDHGFFHPVLHPLDDRRHAHQAGDSQNDPEHGQHRPEFVRPHFLEPD